MVDGVGLPQAEKLPKRPSQPKSGEAKLLALLPKEGWFRWYYEYTQQTESPLSYHIFSSLSVIGATLGRRVWLQWGFFKHWPNFCVVMAGPTGLVKKTSAFNIAEGLISECAVCPILPEQFNAQVLIHELSKLGGHQFVPAPEFSNLFDRQRFNEGLVTKFIRLLDCPAVYEGETFTRGRELVTNVALTVLGATTAEQLVEAVPRQVISSGFLNRFVWIWEEDTERCFSKPAIGNFGGHLRATVNRLKKWEGQVDMSPEAEELYDTWYRERKVKMRQLDPYVAKSVQRGDVHALKAALLINAVQEDNARLITVPSITLAIKLIEYAEERMPLLVHELLQTSNSSDSEFIMKAMRRMGGASTHSTLLRACSKRMNKNAFMLQIKTLEEAGLLTIGSSGLGNVYRLKGEPEL